VVNAHPLGVTTAIVRAGIVLLHRSIELAEHARPLPAGVPAALFESSGNGATAHADLLPLVDRDDSHAEWAAQQPLPEYGRNPYADRVAAEMPTQGQDSITRLPVPTAVNSGSAQAEHSTRGSHTVDMYAEAAPATRSPYASPSLQDELNAAFHSSVSINPALPDFSPGLGQGDDLGLRGFAARESEPEPRIHELAPDALAEEIARAVSVAVAYFEDSLSAVPEVLLSAGPLGADGLHRILREQGVASEEGLRVRELIDSSAVAPGAASARVPRNWLAGVTGALRS
jgi:hypothetical protein